MKKICIVATNGTSLINFRGPFIRELVAKEYDVECVSIEPYEEMGEKIEQLGAKYTQVAGDRVGTGVFSGLRMISEYKKMFKDKKPDICFLYMSKPIAFGGIAASMCKIKHINILVNGLENAYYRSGLKDFVVRCVMSMSYKYVSKRADNVFFQNHDDMNYFKEHHILTKNNACVVGGSGVDMEYFARTEMPQQSVVLMVARLLWSKGIREYLEAVNEVKKKHPDTKVLLVGGLDHNDEALKEEELNRYIESADIEYCGYAHDVRPFLNRCSIFVLPSYHEGLPRCVIEAMSVGRPIVTTDVPGCRETVIDGENGFLVPSKDHEVLSDRISRLVEDKELREKMAEASYQLCRCKFEVKLVNKEMITNIEKFYK
ncbi:MAG: glycosyltransferase family 4 protein [Ruminococcus sp.]|nr:glycosyltransferase family 4 protein [Ruminococcus sp.]